MPGKRPVEPGDNKGPERIAKEADIAEKGSIKDPTLELEEAEKDRPLLPFKHERYAQDSPRDEPYLARTFQSKREKILRKKPTGLLLYPE